MGKVKSGFKSVAKSVDKGLKQLDPTTNTGLANLSTGGIYGMAKNAVNKATPKEDKNSGGSGNSSPAPIGDGKIGNSLDGKSFDEINAEITRRKWDQFEKNDKPYILNYADEITSGKYVDRAVDQAVQGVNQGFAQAENTQSMRDSSMGIGLSSAQVSDRRSDMARNKTASLIDVENNARTAATDRENALLAGSYMPKTGG